MVPLPQLKTTFKPRLADSMVKGLKSAGRLTANRSSAPNSNEISEWKLRGLSKAPEPTPSSAEVFELRPAI